MKFRLEVNQSEKGNYNPNFGLDVYTTGNLKKKLLHLLRKKNQNFLTEGASWLHAIPTKIPCKMCQSVGNAVIIIGVFLGKILSQCLIECFLLRSFTHSTADTCNAAQNRVSVRGGKLILMLFTICLFLAGNW